MLDGMPIDLLQPAIACFPFRLFGNLDFECVGLLGVDSKCLQHILGGDGSMGNFSSSLCE